MSPSHGGGGRRVDLVRVTNPEDEIQRNGGGRRAATEVFPRESKKALLESAKEKGLVKDSRFVRESEAVEQGQGGGPDRAGDSRPLAEILLEQREAKQAKFEEGWKVMKTGKNRPLDEEEAGFLGELLEKEAHVEQRIKEVEKNELQAFREAAANVREDKSKEASGAGKGEGRSVPLGKKRQSALPLKERLKVCKVDEPNKHDAGGTDSEGVLQGLLGEYGSDDE